MQKSLFLDGAVLLCSTDTTIGFISQDSNRLDTIKQRPPQKQYIIALPSLKALNLRARVPTKYKKMLRRAKRTTFIMPNGIAYRVIFDPHHKKLISKMGWAYTTSANISGFEYDPKYAKSVADIVCYPLKSGTLPSKIYKLSKQSIKRIR